MFGEAHGLIVTVILTRTAPKPRSCSTAGVWWQRIGTTGGTSLNISVDTEPLLDVEVTELTAAYEGSCRACWTGRDCVMPEHNRVSSIAIVDRGGQYTKVIDRRLRELQVHTDIVPLDIPAGELERFDALVLSGGPAAVRC